MTRKRSPDIFAPSPPHPTGTVPAPIDAGLDLAAILAANDLVAYDWCLGTDRLRLSANAAAVLKIDPAAVTTGAALAGLIAPSSTETPASVIAAGRPDSGSGVPYRLHYGLMSEDGREIWVEDCGRVFCGPDGRPSRARGVMRPAGQRVPEEERRAFLSRFDTLTGDLNRWRLVQDLAAALEDAVRFRTSCGFLLIAIDNLGRVNECYGFDIGDQVIAAVAERLRRHMRGGDSLGRYSGNRFGIVLRECSHDDMMVAADRLMHCIREEMVTTSAGPVAVSVTAGGVTAPRHARTVDEVQMRAQEALDRAKARRRGSFIAYRPNVERDARRRANVRAADEIVSALNERRVTLAYEPVACATTRRIAFYECLMRMRRSDGTLLPAQEIVPTAERLGLVRLLDHRVLELVVQELKAAPDVHASLNVSPPSTTDPDWWNGLYAHLRSHPGVAERLTIEITETAAIQDLDETRGFVARVKDLGCRIAIDDFGAGYTSFRNLRKLGVDMLKIDGAFVQNILRSEDDAAFVQALIDLAKRLRLATVAEWVQDEASAAQLAAWGCDYLQGEVIGRASEACPWHLPAASGGCGHS